MTIAKFIWYELLTTDVDAAQKFYSAVVGWTVHPSTQPGKDYRMFEIAGAFIGGLAKIPDGAPMPPAWLGYIQVADVDAAIAANELDGGKLYMQKTVSPGVGAFALVGDPQGAPFYVMTPEGSGESASFQPNTPGHIGWNELHASDGDGAKDFYLRHFGWTPDEPIDMGPMGKYHMFSINGVQTVGMMTKADMRHPGWTYYFNVDDIDEAKARVAAAGGAVLGDPHQIPGGDWIVHGHDPQGGQFSLVGPRV